MNIPLSVNELNNQINGILETTFTSVLVEGEISNLTYHSSGHIYFSIKDDKSTISCVMFKGNAQYLKFRLVSGSKIIIRGSVTVYVPRGTYQILCTKIEPSGIGELALAYEQLKTKLQIKGYFDSLKKKKLPIYPKNIYIVTSNTGAAIEDMKKILAHRYPLAKMILIPTLVQGNGAKEEIVRSIKIADKIAQKEKRSLIIIGRGGGTIEDLWAFNEEIVADAIFEATTPIISAVGHENDFVISDFVSDMRASTPSNAIELATPNKNDLIMLTDSIADELTNKMKIILKDRFIELENIKSLFNQHSFAKRFSFVYQTLVSLRTNFNSNMKQYLQSEQRKVDFIMENFLNNNPNKKIKTGFVQVTKDKKIVDIDDFNVNDEVTLETIKYKFECRIMEKNKIN
ncbi:MAG: exodeoxyribonuclease VII large subunit [Epsilonproteobacteria bacterium]|nr:exodeoxyribonuclease VII large subunit [Campylobacterota bacterium]